MKNIPVSLVLASAASFFALAENPVVAAVLIGNLPSTNTDNLSQTLNGLQVHTLSFTLPAGDNYSLGNVILRLGSYTAEDTPIVQIRNDEGTGNPGTTVLANFINPAPDTSATFVNYTFTPTGPLTFLAGTKYWLYVTASSGGLLWRGSSGSPITGIPGIAVNDIKLSTDSGASFSNTGALMTFAIDTTDPTPPPVGTPEPGTPIALSLLGLGLLGSQIRRKRG